MSNWIINWDCMLVTIFECTWGSLNTSLIWFSSPSSTCHSYLFPVTEVCFCFHQPLNVPLPAWAFKFFLHLLIAFVWAQGHKKKKTTSLTVWVSKHNAGVLSSQFQRHSFQVALRRCLFDQLTYLSTKRADNRERFKSMLTLTSGYACLIL